MIPSKHLGERNVRRYSNMSIVTLLPGLTPLEWLCSFHLRLNNTNVSLYNALFICIYMLLSSYMVSKVMSIFYKKIFKS